MPPSPSSLPLAPPGATPIGLFHSMREEDGRVCYFSGLDPIDVHAAGDAKHRNWRVGFLIVHCGLNQRVVAEAFGISLRTAQRLARVFREEGKKGIYRKTRPRSRVVVNAATARKAKALLARGTSGNKVAAELGIAPSTFHENLRAGRIERPKPAAAADATGPVERDARDRLAPMGRAAHNAKERLLAAAGLPGKPLRRSRRTPRWFETEAC